MKKTTQLAIMSMAISMGMASLNAAAQQVYRCANAYSQAPCPGGEVIDVREPLQTSQPGTGRLAAQRNARAAAILEQDRLKLEANAAPAYIPKAPQAAALRKVASKPRKLEQFTAVAPAKPGADKKKKKEKKAPAKD